MDGAASSMTMLIVVGQSDIGSVDLLDKKEVDFWHRSTQMQMPPESKGVHAWFPCPRTLLGSHSYSDRYEGKRRAPPFSSNFMSPFLGPAALKLG